MGETLVWRNDSLDENPLIFFLALTDFSTNWILGSTSIALTIEIKDRSVRIVAKYTRSYF
jgi:hypothetical protein